LEVFWVAPNHPQSKNLYIKSAGLTLLAFDILQNFTRPLFLIWLIVIVSLAILLFFRKPLSPIILLTRYIFIVSTGFILCKYVRINEWPVWMIYRLAGIFALAFLFRDWKQCLGLQFGRPTRRLWLAVFCIVIISVVALIIWFESFPQRSQLATAYIPSWNLFFVVLGGFGFALLNALLEEIIWRGALWQALSEIFAPTLVLIFQAISFGALHIQGIPGGTFGMILAGCYGFMLGILRYKSNGLAMPIIAHIFADLCIYFYLAFY